MQDKKKQRLFYLCAGISNGRSPDAVDGLLLSTACDCRTPGTIQNAKGLIQNKKPKDVKLDSGGYQLHIAEKKGIPMTSNDSDPLKVTEKGINIAPRHVVESGIKMGAHSMVALDFPIRKIKDPIEQEKEFRNKFSRNVRCAIETAALQKELCPQIDLLVAVQAYTEEQAEEFIENLTDKQRAFVAALAEGKSKTAAAIDAFECANLDSAKALGSKMNKDPDIEKALADLMAHEGIPRRRRIQRLRDLIESPDLNAVSRGLDMSWKLDGAYTSGQIEIVDHRELSERLTTLRKECGRRDC